MTRRLAIVLMLAVRPAGGQAERAMGAPNAVLPNDFSQVRGLRELPDGRVLVTDRIEERVYVADFSTGRLQSIGRAGQGPREFRLPTSLSWMPGDSTLLTDEGNSRHAVIGPDLAIHRSFMLEVRGFPTPLGIRGVDRAGRFHAQTPFWLRDVRARGDSVYVLRIDPRTSRVDTLALVKGITSPPNAGAPRMTPGFPFVAFAAEDSWNVRQDGRLVIARSAPYQLQWREPEGPVGSGPVITTPRIPVTAADRTAFVRLFLANSPTSGRGPGGGMGLTPADAMTDDHVRQMVATNSFAEVKGPTAGSRIHFTEDGASWVERSVRLGEAPLFDVIDGTGRVIDRVRLPRGRRLVGLGRRSAYLVATDEDGLERLERYSLR